MIKILYIICKNEKEALDIGRVLIDKKLAACVNVVPVIKSIYRWKGKIVEDSESVLLVKISVGKIEDLISEIKKLHSYDVPSIEVIEVSDGNKEYIDWVNSELNSK